MGQSIGNGLSKIVGKKIPDAKLRVCCRCTLMDSPFFKLLFLFMTSFDAVLVIID